MNASSLKVLIVEDDPETARGLVRLLALDGHEARVAPDGPSALHAAAAEAPDVAFIDVSLRGRMDGYQVARALQEPRDGKRPLLVIITAYAAEELRERSRREGIDLHLTKPVEPEALRSLLRRFTEILTPPGQGGDAA